MNFSVTHHTKYLPVPRGVVVRIFVFVMDVEQLLEAFVSAACTEGAKEIECLLTVSLISTKPTALPFRFEPHPLFTN